ncbi:MAG: Ig-like domain-containing protein, partial [Chitinophagales bacterium]
TVTPVNDPPIAVDDAATTTEDTPVDIDVTNNDYDIDGPIDPTSVTVTDDPSNGTTTVDPVTGVVTYTPETDFIGIDTFEYAVCDTGIPVLCDTAIVVVTVLPGIPDTTYVTVEEDGEVVVCLEDITNFQDEIISVGICGQGEIGTVTAGMPTVTCVTYAPDENLFGQDTVCVVSCNADGICDTSIIVITVTPVNDPPVAVDDAVTTTEDTPIGIDVTNNDFDIDGPIDPTSVTVTDEPSNGTTSVDTITGVVTYSPDEDFIGIDTFEYAVCDTGMPVLCDTAIVVITVTPLSDTIFVTLDEDTYVTLCTDTVAQIDGPVVTIVACEDPEFGTITVEPNLCVTYTPDENYNGQDTICIISCNDPGQCDTTIIVLTVDPVNDQPVANDDFDETDINTPVTTDVIANDNDDIDGGEIDPTSVVITTDPVYGTAVENNDGTVTYTPVDGFIGMDSFQYQVCDLGIPLPALCDTAWVFINVKPMTGDDCFIPESFSPNGDGDFDFFETPCAEYFPEMQVNIYNRWGDQVYQSQIGYQNDWDGTWDKANTDLPDGTYYWVIKFNDGISPDRAGYVMIIR